MGLRPAGLDLHLADVHGVDDDHANREEARIFGLPVKLLNEDKVGIVDDLKEVFDAVDWIAADDLVDEFALATGHVQGDQKSHFRALYNFNTSRST